MFPLKDTVRSRSTPIVNYTIIAINVLVFVFEASLGPRGFQTFVYSFGVVPDRFITDPGIGGIATIFTSMFIHGGWFHLISNMWALFIFGDNVEDRLGSGRYLIFYLLCGLVAALAHIVVASGSSVPVVGASGAISGVMGAYIVLFPLARVVTLMPVFFLPWFVEIPALIYIGMWFISQLFSGIFALGAGIYRIYGGVAWWAHVGGFVIGVISVKLFERKRSYREWQPDEYWPW